MRYRRIHRVRHPVIILAYNEGTRADDPSSIEQLSSSSISSIDLKSMVASPTSGISAHLVFDDGGATISGNGS